MLLDALHLKLQMAAHPRFYDTVGAMLPGVPGRMGVPAANVRAAAKDVIRMGESRELLKEALVPGALKTHEVILVIGLVIAGDWRFSFAERLALAEQYLPALTNWASVDSFAEAMRDFELHREEGRPFIEKLASQKDNPWAVRTALVLLLSHYCEPEEADFAFSIFERPEVLGLAAEHYYVSMALAWALSVFCVKCPEKTGAWLKDMTASGRLDRTTARRAVQKVRDSYRIADEVKQRLTELLKAPIAGSQAAGAKKPANAHPTVQLANLAKASAAPSALKSAKDPKDGKSAKDAKTAKSAKPAAKGAAKAAPAAAKAGRAPSAAAKAAGKTPDPSAGEPRA